MPTQLELIAPRVPFLDSRTGFVSREWYRFFNQLYTRVGGPIAETPIELAIDMDEDSGTEETKMALFMTAQEFGQLPPQAQERIDALEQQVASLQAHLAETLKRLDDIQKGTML